MTEVKLSLINDEQASNSFQTSGIMSLVSFIGTGLDIEDTQ
jgi:hypothetical protein